MLEVVDGQSRVMTLAGAPPTPVVTGLNNPTHVAADSAGNLYITDNGNNKVINLPIAGGTPVILLPALTTPPA